MKKSSWVLIILGLLTMTVLVCGGMVAVSVWLFQDVTGETATIGFGPAIAIVRVEGVIMPGEAPEPSPFSTGDNSTAYSRTVIKHLKQANDNNDVKAVIIYVDSPGGSVYASDEIYLQIKQMTKPVIISMGSLAASGGYYIAAPAQEIWASPHTLTCSIGVISQFLNFEKFSAEYGVTAITVKSGKFKDSGSPFREFNEEDKALWQAMINEAYDEFVRIIADGRKMDEIEVRRWADGRVCTGKQAQQMGFVDSLGYLPDVIKHVGELVKIDGEPRLIEYGKPTNFWGISSSSLSQPSPAQQLQQLLNLHQGSPLMYLYVTP